MPDRRRSADEITPEREDRGLFRGRSTSRVNVALVPVTGLSSRRDVVVRGYVDSGQAVEVVFPGRRAIEAMPLKAALEMLRARAIEIAGKHPPDIESVRFPVTVDGTWRRVFHRDGSGWETRTLQLLAAQWEVTGKKGRKARFGYPSVSENLRGKRG